ncbi:YfzA family protein [Oceanobacillus kapialis]|uniref:YfzA family protein n=1 Tax=Oceanobacillus kapialis TaxID=481353 RepID=A0ABW5PWC3_9BACI
MNKEQEIRQRKLLRNWVITIGGFVVMQFIFVLIDGTFLEPNDGMLGNFANRIVEADWFVEWLIFYENPFFNIITVLAVLHIVFHGIKDLIRIRIWKKTAS